MPKKTPEQKRLTKKLQQQRYRAKHKVHEAAKEFKRAQFSMSVFLWHLYGALNRFAHAKGIPICPREVFKAELDRPEFKKAFLMWKNAGNPENLKPVVFLTKFKLGFVPENMNWSSIDPYRLENKKHREHIQILSAELNEQQKWANQGFTDEMVEAIIKRGFPTVEEVAFKNKRSAQLLEQVRKLKNRK